MMTTYQIAFILPGNMEWIVIGVIALLIFGRRLPEVARALGNSIVQFKKGVTDVQNEIEDASAATPSKNPLEAAPAENKVKPLEPYDERLGGNPDELKNLQKKGTATQQQQPAEDTA